MQVQDQVGGPNVLTDEQMRRMSVMELLEVLQSLDTRLQQQVLQARKLPSALPAALPAALPSARPAALSSALPVVAKPPQKKKAVKKVEKVKAVEKEKPSISDIETQKSDKAREGGSSRSFWNEAYEKVDILNIGRTKTKVSLTFKKPSVQQEEAVSAISVLSSEIDIVKTNEKARGQKRSRVSNVMDLFRDYEESTKKKVISTSIPDHVSSLDHVSSDVSHVSSDVSHVSSYVSSMAHLLSVPRSDVHTSSLSLAELSPSQSVFPANTETELILSLHSYSHNPFPVALVMPQVAQVVPTASRGVTSLRHEEYAQTSRHQIGQYESRFSSESR